MTGAESLMKTLLANSVDVCFMNPGTSEMQFVAALDRVPGMRGILCLQEGVCAGAADGYARMKAWPAATLLHLGPGLANALSNLHNARKARSPVVNIVGEHATHHMRYDAPLTADVEAVARPMSGWVKTVRRVEETGRETEEAVRAAIEPPGQVATLIVPADFSWSESNVIGHVVPRPQRRRVEQRRVEECAFLLRSGANVGLLLSGSALTEPGLRAAGVVAQHTGARVFVNRYAGRLERGAGVYPAARIPYFPEPASELLAGIEALVLVEAEPPVSFFGYPGKPSLMTPEGCAFVRLAEERENGAEALLLVAEELGAASTTPPVVGSGTLDWPRGEKLTSDVIGAVLSAMLPDWAIVSDEMVSSGEGVNARLETSARHDLLPVTGGSIGQGLPVALGAAVACPDRKVVCLEADGSAMYTLPALWTMARERLDVITVVFANKRYKILDVEMKRTNAGEIGPRAAEMMDIGRPDLDWVKLSEAQGVEASRATNTNELADQFSSGVKARGPRLIEAVIE
jgi:acetolactate synthase-1/2/3 large subunit